MQRQPIERRHVPTQTRAWRDSRVETSAPTPGHDDAPYIQFAIDQLTRDEEVSGRSRDSRESPDVSSLSSKATPARKSLRISGIDTPGDQSSSQELRAESVPRPVSKRDEPMPPVIPPKSPVRPQSRAVTPTIPEREEPRQHVLIPVNPHNLDLRYPLLDFVPRPLRLLSILALILFCIILIIFLVISCALGAEHNGLLGYDGVGTSRYFVFEYLPQFFATLVIIWLFVIQSAIQRTLPFALLTKANHYPEQDVLNSVPLYITNFLIPNRSMFRGHEPSLRYCAIIFWLTIFTIPLSSSLYQTRFYPSVNNGTFIWTTVQPVSIVLIFLYTLLIIALILAYLRFSRHSTGLKWDPISLADIFVLVRRTSNLTKPNRTSAKTRSGGSSRPVSIGYWESSSRPGNIFHGIGAPSGLPAHDPEKGLGQIHTNTAPEAQPPQASTFESWQSANHGGRYHGVPWFLRETYLLLFSLIALALLIAFLVVTYLNSQLLFGFLPLLPSAIAATAMFQSFSPSNFLYSFLPALLGTFLPLLWASMDSALRYLEPFAALSNARSSGGVSADNSLLLSYPSELPLLVSLRALINRHFRLAWISLLALFSWSIPVLAGGIFTAQFVADPGMPGTSSSSQDGRILMRPDAKALYCLTVFLILYALSWFLLFPGAARRLLVNERAQPVDVRYLGGLREIIGEGVLAGDVWREPASRADLVGRLVGWERVRRGGWVYRGGRILRV